MNHLEEKNKIMWAVLFWASLNPKLSCRVFRLFAKITAAAQQGEPYLCTTIKISGGPYLCTTVEGSGLRDHGNRWGPDL